MMAAGRAAELGAKVLLLEKMELPGKKILISGNGRCNLTNARDMESFIEQFGPNGRFLYSAFSRFFRDDIITLLKRYGVECRTGPSGKVYPVSDNARDVVKAFNRYMADVKVEVRYNKMLTNIIVKDGRLSAIETTDGIMPAKSLIIATGGSSHRQTGSDGGGYNLAAKIGHTIIGLRPALVPMVVRDIEKAKRMQGASLRDVRLTSFQCTADKIDFSLIPKANTGPRLPGKRPKPPVIESRTGDAIITHFGLSGPAALEMSLAMVDALENGPVSVMIDFLPDKDKATVRKELQQAFDASGLQTAQNAIKRILPKKLRTQFTKIADIPPDKLCNQINAAERESLLDLLKSLKFDIERPFSMETAMVTAGGVSLKEVDPRTMASKIVEGVYLCGELLDLDAGTGGYNLQAAFSTGYIAGESAFNDTRKP